MSTSSAIDPETIRAYERTHYVVADESDLILRVGQFSPGLAALHARHGCSTSAFLTACNPYSRPMDAATNQARQQQLARELQAQGWTFRDGEGQDPHGAWTAEASFLVLGLDRETASGLAHRFEQNAYLWIGADAIPRLVLLR